MSVRREERRDPITGAVRKYWIVDVNFQHPDGKRERVRKVSPVQTQRGAEHYERELRSALLGGTFGREEPAAAPTVEQFQQRFIDDWCRANKQKPSGIEAKESVFRRYLVPIFGNRRLDTLSPADEDRLKKHMIALSTSTYNNTASVMNSALKAAVRWRVIPFIPHRFALLKRDKRRAKFYDFDEYQWLVDAAQKIDSRIHVAVLLGGDAGLRRGEIIALEWSDVDLRRGQLTIERSEWKSEVTATKGMKVRVVPMTQRLQKALAAFRHLRGDRVLYADGGSSVTAKVLQKWMAQAQRRANLRATGAIHILRHTFCSHLAMKGAPALSIRHLAGHEDLQTTLGYMHLAKGETERAIGLLETPIAGSSVQGNGNLTATEHSADQNTAS